MLEHSLISSDDQQAFPTTDLVILAGGQARRMNGVNKLLQTFDQQIQLIKIYQGLKNQVNEIWINSHRDYASYRSFVPCVQCYQDDEAGFLGPLMGIKSAWSHVSADYVLFVPCDVAEIPKQLIQKLHQGLAQHPSSAVAYASINGTELYPLCLVKRQALVHIRTCLAQEKRSLRHCFTHLYPQVAYFEDQSLFLHSINSLEELQQYQQLKLIKI